MSVGLRQAWRDSKPVFELVPNSKRTIAWATLGTVVNGVTAVFFGLSLGPAMNAVQGAASSWWMVAPLAACVVEHVTSIRPTNKLIALSERTRLDSVNRIVERALRRNKDTEAAASNAEVSVAVAKQVEDTRELLVDIWRWAVAQVSKMGAGVAAVAAIAATGYAGFGPVGPLAFVVGAVSTAIASSVVTNAVAIRKNRATDATAVELHEAVQENLIDTDSSLIRSVGGVTAVQQIAGKLGSLARRLHDTSTDNRHWVKSSYSLSTRLVQLSVALLPLLAVPMFGVTSNVAASFATSIAVGLTLAPVALSAADLTAKSLQTLTTSVSRLGKLLQRLGAENAREGTRTLPSLDRTSIEISNGRVAVGVDGSRVTVLDEVHLAMQLGGRVHVVSGASGIGKSTLLDVVSASMTLEAGSITIADIPYPDVDETSFRERVRKLPQRLTVADNLTIEEIAQFAQIARDADRPSLSGSERRASLRRCMDDLGLRGVDFDRKWKTLSGGQQRRAMLSVVLTSGAEVIVLDEPTNDLDETSIDVLAQRINRDTVQGRTFIVSSHDKTFLRGLVNCTHHEIVRDHPDRPAKLRSGVSAGVALSTSSTMPSRRAAGAQAPVRPGSSGTLAARLIHQAGTHEVSNVPRPLPARIQASSSAALGYRFLSSEFGVYALDVMGRMGNSDDARSAWKLAEGLQSSGSHDWIADANREVSWLTRIGKDLESHGIVDSTGRLTVTDHEVLGPWLLRHRSAICELSWKVPSRLQSSEPETRQATPMFA